MTWKRYPIWDHWRATTRFLNSTRQAMLADAERWEKLPVKSGAPLVLEYVDGERTYRVESPEHVSVLRDPVLLCGMTLMYSYALVEEFAREIRAETRGSDDLSGGIETWGSDLLEAVGGSWEKVLDGKTGAVETAIVRNAFAHGEREYTDSMRRRFQQAMKADPPWAAGSPIVLDTDRLETLRARLRSLCRNLSDGMAAREKARSKS